MKKGYVSEIYVTLQGEGIYLGEQQVFVRLAGCPLRCVWCDTPGSLSATGHPGMSVEEVVQKVRRAAHSAKTVSLTGGEPLAQVDFLTRLLPALKKSRWRTYLETAGVHPGPLSRVIRHCDVVSMDIKLPSAVGRAYWKEHADFLKVAGKKAFVKIVLTRQSTEAELQQAFALIAARSRKTPVVLQPVTEILPLSQRFPSPDAGGGKNGKGKKAWICPPEPTKVSAWLTLAQRDLSDVRVLPQRHPLWGIP
jgi:7-carboxy-7-deazaguanine synthase